MEWCYLFVCTEKQLKKLGFTSDIDRQYFVNKIEIMVNSNPFDDNLNLINENINNNNENGNISNQSKNKKEKNEDENECCICYNNKINTICTPCGHACMCKSCSNDYLKESIMSWLFEYCLCSRHQSLISLQLLLTIHE